MHLPVLLKEVVMHLVRGPGGVFVDGTLGGGGHASAVLEAAGPEARVIGIDRDASALERARQRMGPLAARCTFVQGAFADMASLVPACDHGRIEAVLMDYGLSSDQLDDPARGFSFQADGPLDMRLDRSQPATAADLVNTMPEADLASLIWQQGDEPMSRRIARAIVEARTNAPLRTTGELAALVERAKGGRRGRIHPATQTFQALRMAVNGELEQVEHGLEAAFRLVRPGGRVGAISFHSGEDRVTKQTMARHVGREVSLAAGGSRWEGEKPAVAWVVKRPAMADEEECAANPRARSAKLRVVERADDVT